MILKSFRQQMKTTKEILVEKLEISGIDKQEQNEITKRLVELSVKQTLDELTNSFSDEELEEFQGLDFENINLEAFGEKHLEKISKFEEILNLKINQNIAEFRIIRSA